MAVARPRTGDERDAIDVLGTLDVFHLMFVDASPSSTAILGSAIDALHRGVMIVDRSDRYEELRDAEGA